MRVTMFRWILVAVVLVLFFAGTSTSAKSVSNNGGQEFIKELKAKDDHISRREVKRQDTNCIELDTPEDPVYQYVLDASGYNRLDIEVKASRNVHIALSAEENDLPAMYEVIIGAFSNTKSTIRRSASGSILSKVNTGGILSGSEVRGFWITWNNGVIKAGKAGETTPFVEATDPDPLEVNFIGCRTGGGATGEWDVCLESESTVKQDPHVMTFDGLKYNFNGYCSYTLLKSCDDVIYPPFEVSADFRGRDPSRPYEPPTFMVAFNITSNGKQVIRINEDDVVLIKGKPMTSSSAVIGNNEGDVKQNENRIMVYLKEPALSLTWQRRIHGITIALNDIKLRGKVCGLLGNDDGNPHNEFIKPDGERTFNADEFGNSWLIPGSCP